MGCVGPRGAVWVCTPPCSPQKNFLVVFNYWVICCCMVIQIDKHIPVNKFLKRARKHQYPFAQMDPGDSFYVEGDLGVCQTVRTLMWRFTKETGWKFVTRRDEGGLRVWRVG